MTNTLKWLLAVLVIVILGGSGYCYYQNFFQKEKNQMSLTIIWEDPNFEPKCFIWMQDFINVKPICVTSEENKVTIPREGTNQIPTKLLVIPKNNTSKPMVLEVSKKEKAIYFTPESIPQDEVWFWGITPESPCSPGATSVTVRLLTNTGIYSEFYGAFVWHITKEKSNNINIPFYFSNYPEESISSISIEGFKEASDIAKALCKIHTGGECEFVLETNRDVWGKSYQIIFKKQFPYLRGCPLY